MTGIFRSGWMPERILCTPTGVCKGMMHPDDLIVVDYKGQ